MKNNAKKIISIKSLNMEINEKPILKNVSININHGEMVGLVGESGSGKSVTALSILKLIDENVMLIKSGQILFMDEDLLTKSEKEIQKIRGKDISMIFQEPMTSLNPVFTIGDQINEVHFIHSGISIDLYISGFYIGVSMKALIVSLGACSPYLLDVYHFTAWCSFYK